MRHYLDHASTTPLRITAAEAVVEWAARLSRAEAGDAGRVHEEGRVARVAVETAREQVAALAGVAPSRVVFTSGGTEAVNTAVWAAGASSVLCAPVEHSAVREAAARTGRAREIPVLADGSIDPAAVGVLLGESGGGGVLVNCQWANHEVGTIQDVAAVAQLCSERGARLHVDAAAAFGHITTDLGSLGADFVSLSAHKMGGPPGVGALVLGRGVRLRPLLLGGTEERGRRAGAENLLGIVGFGAAAAELSVDGQLAEEEEEAGRQRDELLAAAVSVKGVRPIGPANDGRRLPYVAPVMVEDVLGEAVLLALDRAGIAAHSGSACSSETLEPSPVLHAMGLDPDRSLRLSVGWSTTRDDIEAFATAFPRCVEDLRGLRAS